MKAALAPKDRANLPVLLALAASNSSKLFNKGNLVAVLFDDRLRFTV